MTRTDTLDPSEPARDAWGRGYWELALVALLALAVRLIDLGHPPFIDEFFHVLAAQSAVEQGSLVIHAGEPYTRGALFTYIVAGMFAFVGDSLAVARLPAVVFGVLLVCLIFAWLRAEASRTAAWTASLLLAFAPVSIYLSQWVRFYTAHALVFWLAAYGVYRLVARTDPAPRRWWIAAATAAAMLLALHFQVSTIVGLAGIALFAVLVEGGRFVTGLRSARQRWRFAGAALAALVIILSLFLLSGFADWLVSRARLVDVWAIEHADNPRFYHWMMTEQYGFLWTLFPVAVLVALAARWRPALLFTAVFAVAIVAHSLAAWKAERYVYYAMPAFFALWGLAAGELVPWLWVRLRELAGRLPGPLSPRARVVLAGLAMLIALAFAVSSTTAYATTRQIWFMGRSWTPPSGHYGEWYRGHPDWAAAAHRLRALAENVDVVVVDADVKAVYYLGDADFILYANYLMRRDGKLPEFSRWWRVGRPAISEAASVDLLMRCSGSGLIVAEDHVWGWRGGVPRETAEFIEEHTTRLELPGEAGLRAYRWETPVPELSPRCEAVRTAGQEDGIGAALPPRAS